MGWCVGQLEWINSETGQSLPVELHRPVTLENSRFVPAPWMIKGKIVQFVPEHVWTPAPTDDVPEGSYDDEYEERPPKGYVVVRLYDKHVVAEWGRHCALRWDEYAQVVEAEKEQSTLTDPSDNDTDGYVGETSEEEP